MASCSPFDVHFKGNAQDLFEKAAKMIHDAGGDITGNASRGTFSVPVPVRSKIAGSYSISGQTLTVHVTQRPFYITCSRIKSFVEDLVGRLADTAFADL